MMTTEKLVTGMSYIALGAFAAYLGIWWNESGTRSHLIPALLGSGMALLGLTLLIRNGKRSARIATGHSLAKTRGEEESAGEAALLGHEMKNYLCTLKGNASLLRER